MKNALLFILMTLGKSLAAQFVLPDGLPQITSQLSEQVNLTLRATEFYLQQLGKKNGTADRSATLRLDSVLTFVDYVQSDSTLVSRSVFTYPTENATVQTSSFWDGGGQQLLNRVTATTDAEGRLISTFSETFHPVAQQWTPGALVERFPRGNSESQTDSVLVKEWSTASGDWQLVLAIHHHFSDAGLLLEDVFTHFYSTGTEVFKNLYEYNAAGDNTVMTFVFVDGGQIKPISRIDRQFENHLMTEEILGLQDSFMGLIPDRKTTITYTGFGKPLQKTVFKWSNPAWIQIMQSTFEYDIQERQIWETTQVTTNGSDFRYKIFTGYREGELPALTELFHWDGNNAFLLIERDHYYYSEPVSEVVAPDIEHGILVVSPNPSSSFITVPLEYTDALEVFDESGTPLMQFNNVSYNTSVNLSALPSGVYVLRAVSGNKSYTGRVVKI